ncbi:MAG: cyclic nucleotide-binding domain-containing protein [Actinomycetota bacterium]
MRKRDAKVRRLRSLASFAHLSDDDLVEIASSADLVAMRAGDVVHPQGAPNNDALLIVDGTAVLGTDALLGRGEWFGAVALLDGDTEDAELRMLTDGVLLVFGRREFAGSIVRIPAFWAALAKDLSQELRRQHDRDHAGTHGHR